MTTDSPAAPSVIPAQLSFLAIYCPSLGNSDESIEDQIVFYSSKKHLERRRQRHDRSQPSKNEDETQEKNERLRQVGLAQGMVDFAKCVSTSHLITQATLTSL